MSNARGAIGAALATALLAFTAASVVRAAADPLVVDLALLGGRVIDGSGAPAREADVLVRGDEIVFVGDAGAQPFDARETLRIEGHVVAPGFVDLHAHGNPLVDGSLVNFLRQGVTTVALGQDGRSAERESRADFFEGVGFESWRRNARAPERGEEGAVTLVQWIDALGPLPLSVNVAPLVGHATLRSVSGAADAPVPTVPQMAAMKEMLRFGLENGAFGLSQGLEYVPGRYAATSELLELAKVVGAHDGVLMSHMRSEDNDKIAAAIAELLVQGAYVRVHVSHLKIVFATEAGEAEGVLEQLRDARNEGIAVSADVYPYLAGFADLVLTYPDWARRESEFEALRENEPERLKQAIRERVIRRNGPESILIAQGEYAGSTLAEVAATLGMPFEDVIVDVFGYGGPNSAHFIMRADVQDAFITDPDTAISTDGGPWIYHPRSWGSFPRVIEEYVVRRRLLTLEEAVRKMSGLPATVLGLRDRGFVRPGLKADLVVFDPAGLRSRAEWTAPEEPPTGFEAIIVNGEIAVREDRLVSEKAGRVLERKDDHE